MAVEIRLQHSAGAAPAAHTARPPAPARTRPQPKPQDRPPATHDNASFPCVTPEPIPESFICHDVTARRRYNQATRLARVFTARNAHKISRRKLSSSFIVIAVK